MRKILAAGMAALTVGGAVATAALPSTVQAREWHGGHHNWRGHAYRGDWRHHRHDDGAAIVAGIAGLAIGAALADDGRGYYGYGYGYPAYYDYGYRPAVCESDRWVWDPYIGHRVLVRRHYPC
jgi:hypothetical protein